MLVLLFAACDTPPTPQQEPAVDTAGPAVFDLGAYCDAMCERTTSCGIKTAEAAAALGGEGTEEALRKARGETKALKASCVTGCQSEPVDPLDRTLASQAKQCLHQATCERMEQCLSAL